MSAEASPYEASGREPTPREAAAWDWLSRCERGLSPSEEADFQQWLSAHAENAQVFDELTGTWGLLQQVKPYVSATPEPTEPPRIGRSTILRLSWPLAIAAAMAVGYFGYWKERFYEDTFRTAIGEVRALELPDGSRVRLNTDSEVAVRFDSHERRLCLLRGEANFAVARSPARPFLVEANAVLVRAVGTTFNVRVTESAVEVLVLEGRVQVNDGESGKNLLETSNSTPDGKSAGILEPGQRALVTGLRTSTAAVAVPLAEITDVSAAEVHRRNAWSRRRIEFESAPLSEIVAEFNRFSTDKITISQAGLAEQYFGGSFNVNDVDGLLRMLSENFGIKVERQEGIIRLSERE